ncbi:hypothetical protein [Singulisphaera sp. PoT]|uniref:hypothetical protein n=1 Tax=Singulisphaera sp. PoT TaxID=3411797 RepID=UPI003BF53497
MGTIEDRSSKLENLSDMMTRLADSSLTIAEADGLRMVIHRLLDELGHATDAASKANEVRNRFCFAVA